MALSVIRNALPPSLPIDEFYNLLIYKGFLKEKSHRKMAQNMLKIKETEIFSVFYSEDEFPER